MKVARATLEDAFAIATMHIRSWQAAYGDIVDSDYLASLSIEDRATRWREILTSNASSTLVARLEGDLAGFVSYGKCRDEGAPADQGEIWALYTAPDAWGQGVGRKLVVQAMKELKLLGHPSASLWVLARNHRGRRFYESCGFQKIQGSEKLFELGGRQVEEVAYIRHDV